MKIKNILLAITFVIIGQNISAAHLEVYNQTYQDLQVTVWYGTRDLFEQKYILARKKYLFKSGIHAISNIKWQTGPSYCYSAAIPSSRTMLMGTVVIRENGNFDLNFNQNGVSNDNVRSANADKCNWQK